MKSLIAWFENRTGAAALAHAALYEHIPGGARWRYVWGSTLVFAFAVQVITGIFLWLSYSPSSQTAWESVYYIQYEMTGGWLLRGLHHFMAQAMVVLLVIHLAQVVIDGAYRAPREVNFWLGLILMQIVLGLSLTGYLLPWDQKGYWATSVATNLMGIVPGVGAQLQQVVVGGPDYGHHTLTRFFAMHAGVLPGLLVAFLVIHVALFRRHGLHAKTPLKGADSSFWPDQILKDSVACLAVLAAVLVLTFWSGVRSEQGLMAALASEHPGDHLGAELGAPADGASPYAAARPEWYFLFLFQFLKFFEGSSEVFGAIVVPGLVMGFLFVMPIIGISKFGHRLNIAVLLLLFAGIGVLTAQALWDDRRAAYIEKPELVEGPEADNTALHHWQGSQDYLEAAEAAEVSALRARTLARGLGIPPEGAITLMRNDPKTSGAELFTENCASCHNHTDAEGHGIVCKEPSAPNLYGFASRDWIAGLLTPDKIATPQYFGLTEHKAGDMVSFVQGDDFKAITPAERSAIAAALSSQAQLPAQLPTDKQDATLIAQGDALIRDKAGCVNCHRYGDTGDLGAAPDLGGYGSREWLTGMISDPKHERFYGDKNDRMPAFAEGSLPALHRLTARQLGLIVDFLRQDWHEPAAETAVETVAPAPQE